MKLRYLQLRAWQITLALTAFALALPAANTNSPSANPVAGKTEVLTPAVFLPSPQSIFIIPKNPAEGKDPFFPSSTRVYASEMPAKVPNPVVPVGDLSLKGISGTAAEPLAIINTTTFTTGEENDVITSAGRMRIRCVAINMGNGSVLVQAGGERRELRLQARK
jgi:hypothetical protein